MFKHVFLKPSKISGSSFLALVGSCDGYFGRFSQVLGRVMEKSMLAIPRYDLEQIYEGITTGK